MNKPLVSRAFTTILVVVVLIACYLIFKPFLIEILIAMVLVSIFYRPYEWLVKKLKIKASRQIASLIMCLLVVLIIIVPLTNLIVLAAQKSVVAYSDMIKFLNEVEWNGDVGNGILEKAQLIGVSGENLQGLVVEVAKKSSNWLVGGAASLLRGTTSFLISLILIIFTMFFFFIDGKKMLEKLMHWTPLPNKYDIEIFKKFRDVSYSTFVSTFIVAIVQGSLGALAFMIVGLPAFFAGIAMAFLSIIPYVGAFIIWFPAAIYLLFIGQTWQGIFMLLWGVIVVSNIDNLIRAYMIKGKAQVHPIFIIFAILGGIVLFGFWGVVIGPLVISIAVTVMHIYELEYKNVLEK